MHLDGGQPEAKAVQSFRWVPVAELDDLDWVPLIWHQCDVLSKTWIKYLSNRHHRLYVAQLCRLLREPPGLLIERFNDAVPPLHVVSSRRQAALHL